MPLLGSTPPPRRGFPGLLAAFLFVLGPILAWLRLTSPLVGFAVFALGGIGALVVGGGSLLRMMRGRGITRGGMISVLTAIVFIAIAGRGVGVPRINDFTTDLDDPPAFRQAASLPANAGRDLSYPRAFEAEQRTCCPDLHPARLRGNIDDAFTRAEQVARAMPSWTVTAADRSTGTIEATDTSRLFRFVDDIVIRVRPDGGGQVRVDMRSKSRDGKGDLGANAARIRHYIDALEAAVQARP